MGMKYFILLGKSIKIYLGCKWSLHSYCVTVSCLGEYDEGWWDGVRHVRGLLHILVEDKIRSEVVQNYFFIRVTHV